MTIHKDIRDGLERHVSAYKRAAEAINISEEQLDRTERITRLEKEMFEAAETLEFEKAARLRDRITELKEMPELTETTSKGSNGPKGPSVSTVKASPSKNRAGRKRRPPRAR